MNPNNGQIMLVLALAALFVGFVVWRLIVSRRLRQAGLAQSVREMSDAREKQERRDAWTLWARRVESLYETRAQAGAPPEEAFQLSRDERGVWRVSVRTLQFGWRYLGYPTRTYEDPPPLDGNEVRWTWEDVDLPFASQAEAEAFIAQAAQPDPGTFVYNASGDLKQVILPEPVGAPA